MSWNWKSLLQTKCDSVHQKGDNFSGEINFIFFYLVYKSFFLSFKMTPHLAKLHWNFTIDKDQKFSLFFFIIFWMFSSI